MFEPVVATLITSMARTVTGARSLWLGCAPVPVQRIYYANHSSHGDFVLLWASLPQNLRKFTRPVAGSDYWNKSTLRRYIINRVFNGVLIDRERKDPVDNPLAAMTAYGAELILVTQEEGMEGARDLAERMATEGRGLVLDQFANGDNPEAHYTTTGPEIWRQTQGTITHFVSSMGTTGTIMGNSRYLKEQNPEIQIVGLQPMEGAAIPGIRRWPEEYLPKIYNAARVDRIIDMAQREAEDTTRRLAREEGIFCGVSSGGAVAGMLRLSQELENAVIVAIICDRGDRYLSTGIFDAPN